MRPYLLTGNTRALQVRGDIYRAEVFNPGAGPIRNKKIVDAADKLIAFRDGKSRPLNYIIR